MAKLHHATLEPNDDNTDGAAITLYFSDCPTRAEVQVALNQHRDLCLASEDENFDAFVRSGGSHLKRSVVRVQVLPLLPGETPAGL